MYVCTYTHIHFCICITFDLPLRFNLAWLVCLPINGLLWMLLWTMEIYDPLLCSYVLCAYIYNGGWRGSLQRKGLLPIALVYLYIFYGFHRFITFQSANLGRLTLRLAFLMINPSAYFEVIINISFFFFGKRNVYFWINSFFFIILVCIFKKLYWV